MMLRTGDSTAKHASSSPRCVDASLHARFVQEFSLMLCDSKMETVQVAKKPDPSALVAKGRADGAYTRAWTASSVLNMLSVLL